MKPSSKLSGVLAARLVTTIVTPVTADPPNTAGQTTVTTELIGYQETPLTINSAGSGEFTATIQDNGTAISYQLTYRDLSSPAIQAHVHFGRPAITGMVVLSCARIPRRSPRRRVYHPGAAGFAEMLHAIRAGAAYANVHTILFLSGEIRGCLESHGPGGSKRASVTPYDA